MPSRRENALDCARMSLDRMSRAVALLGDPPRYAKHPRQEATSQLLHAIRSAELALRYHLGLEGY